MPLQKTTVAVDFTQGVDAKTDEKLGAKPTRLEHAVFSEHGTLAQRLGEPLVADLSGSMQGVALGFYSNNKTLFTRDANQLYVYDNQIADLGVIAGQSRSYAQSRRQVVRSGATQKNFDCASYSPSGTPTHGVNVWQDDFGSLVQYSVFHEAQGRNTYSSFVPGSTYGRVVALTDRVVIVYGDSSSRLNVRYFDPASPFAPTDVLNIASDYYYSANNILDAVAFNGGVAVAYVESGAGNIKLVALSNVGVVTHGPVTISSSAPVALHLQALSSSALLVLWGSATTSKLLKGAIYNASLGSVMAATTLYTGGVSDSIGDITSLASTGQLFWESGDEDTAIHSAIINTSGTLTTAEYVYLHNAFIAASPIALNGGTCLFVSNYEPGTQVQPSVFAVMERSEPVMGSTLKKAELLAPMLQGTAGLYSNAGSVLPRSRAISYGGAAGVAVPLRERGRLEFFSHIDVTPDGICEISLIPETRTTTVERKALQPTADGDILYFPGPVLLQTDGRYAEAVGFQIAPTILTVTHSASTGSVANGAYQYCVVAEYVDVRGRVYRSAPSVPVSFTQSSGPTQVDVTIQSIPFLYWPKGDFSGVVFAVYRTQASGTTFHRVNPQGGVVAAPNTDTVVCSDTSDDSTIASGEILYTTGGYLESAPPPASVFAHVHGRRLFLVKANDRNTLAYSKEIVDGYGPEFNESLEMPCGPNGGDIVGTASVDDKLVILRERNIQYVVGSGPTDAGLQNDYSPPQEITNDTGCVAPASILNTPDGVFFKGQRGYYLINRSLQLVWLGEEVESLTGIVSSVALVPQKKQIRVCQSDGSQLVYDYNYRQWSSFPLATAGNGAEDIVAVAALGASTFLLTSGSQLLTEDSTGVACNIGDATTGPAVTIVTPWMKVAGVQGFQRVYRALFEGTINRNGAVVVITIDVGYDYEPSFTSAGTFEADSDPMQFRLHLPRQKCEAVRFRLTTDHNAQNLRGLSLTNLTLEVGVKQGAYKMGVTQTVSG